LLLFSVAELALLDDVDKRRRALIDLADAAVPVGLRNSMRIIPIVVMKVSALVPIL
jgi:hypothetical protein